MVKILEKRPDYWTVVVYVKVLKNGGGKDGYIGSRCWNIAFLEPEPNVEKVLDVLKKTLEPVTKKAMEAV